MPNSLSLNKKKLLESLEEYRSKYPLENQFIDRAIIFLGSNSDCFERTCQIGHFTASAWVINSTESEILLMHHKKLNSWMQVGGHADGESDLLQVALKEIKEESGLKNVIPLTNNIFDLDIHIIPPYKNDPEHYHYDVRYIIKAIKDDTLTKNEESNDLRWFDSDIDALPSKNPSIVRMFNIWIEFKKST